MACLLALGCCLQIFCDFCVIRKPDPIGLYTIINIPVGNGISLIRYHPDVVFSEHAHAFVETATRRMFIVVRKSIQVTTTSLNFKLTSCLPAVCFS